LTRREALLATGSVGIASVVLHRALAAQVVERGEVSLEMIQHAEWVADLQLTDEEREAILKNVEENLSSLAANRERKIEHTVSPAIRFFADPFAASLPAVDRNAAKPMEESAPQRPSDETLLAFLPLTELAALIRTRNAYKAQTIQQKATVAARLEEAGAVMIAKLSMEALAMGDKWFGQMTRNPWDPRQGSSGSSAGSAAAVAAGAVGFAIGTETVGSIITPCKRCGATGLRPTFGRVSRRGCMTLCWSMDKLGPIARAVEDTALVLDAIHGTDGHDPTVVNRPLKWPPQRELSTLRVGFIESEWEDDDQGTLDILRSLGVKLVPIEIPKTAEVWPACIIVDVESAAIFDDLVRDKVTEDLNEWPELFRAGEFITGVEYLRAMRIRTQLMQRTEAALQDVDLYVGGNDLPLTNLTGHPSICLPYGFRDREGRKVPKAITFTGKLFQEANLLVVARAFQIATGSHLERPPLEALLVEDQPTMQPP
jgi:Asp-tRNA(Asn)/Glu-tRNA(Gln) amidotransferase A subunit family amidase